MRHIGFAVLCVFVLSSCMDARYLPQFARDGKGASTVDVPEYYEAPPEHLKQSPIEVVSSEDLLDADGNWNVVEQGRTLDPATAHLEARNRVNTKRRKRMADLTAHFEPDAKSGEDGKLRVLKIEATEDVPEFEVATASTSISAKSEPPDAAAGEDFGRGATPFRGLKALFTGGSSSPKPKRKPKLLTGLEDDAVEPVVQEVASVIVPPALPDFRKPPSALLKAGESVIIPKRKPVRVASKQLEVRKKPANVSLQREKSPVVDKVRQAAKYSKAIKMRSGRHPGRTRFVIEVSEITKYKVAIDSIRNVLRIKMHNTRWDMKPQGTLGGSKLLGTYIAREQSDGSILLEVRLSEKTKILGTLILPPNNSAKHRVVIDLDH